MDPDPWSRSPPKFNHVFTGPFPKFPKKFHADLLRSFCTKLLRDKQADRHTNNDDCISSLVEVIMSFLPPNHQCQSTEVNTKYWSKNKILTITCGLASSFLHPQPDSWWSWNLIAPFTPDLQCQKQNTLSQNVLICREYCWIIPYVCTFFLLHFPTVQCSLLKNNTININHHNRFTALFPSRLYGARED